MKSPVICSVAMVAALVVWCEPSCLGARQAPVLSLDLARKMAAGCEAKAKEMSWKMNISVVDSGANQIFFEKMDGAYLGSGDIALHKAQTSARFPFPTRGVRGTGLWQGSQGGHGARACASPRHHCICRRIADHDRGQGAIGGIGVSGGTADQDETCAQAGIDAAKDALK